LICCWFLYSKHQSHNKPFFFTQQQQKTHDRIWSSESRENYTIVCCCVS
jgi:uncharacterized protein YpiB (UPF0302 family)